MKYIKLLFLLIILILICSIYLINNTYEKFQTQETYDIVIIAGQSNACGAGRRNICDSTQLSGCTTVNNRANSSILGPITNIPNNYDSPNPNIKQFSANYSNRSSRLNNRIIDAIDPLEHLEDRTNFGATIGFAMSFAKEYLNVIKTKNKVLLVGCGFGGTGMYNGRNNYYWKKPSQTDNINDSLYTMTVNRLQTLKNLLGLSNKSKVVAFLWHQGENNSASVANLQTFKNTYKSDLKNSLNGMREDIMKIFSQSYKFPILLGGLSPDLWINRITNRNINTSNADEMSETIKEVTMPTDSNYIVKSAFIPTTAITSSGSYNFNRRLEGDAEMNSRGDITKENSTNTHFSASSYRELGKRYFYFYNLIK